MSNSAKEKLIEEMLVQIGENPFRDGLVETPKRVVKMWDEIFGGYDLKNKPKVSIFKNGKDGITYDEMIIDSGDFYSHCEHHMVPFFGKYWFGYIPSKTGGIIGLSKVARIINFHSARLQIQERLVHDVVDDIWNMLSKEFEAPLGMGLVMEGEHLCKTMRGVKKKGTMRTAELRGVFKDIHSVRDEFFNCVK